MKRIFLAFSMTILLVLVSFAFSNTTYAQPSLNDIKKEREEIKAQLTEAEAEIADVLFDIEKQNEDLSNLKDALKDNQQHLKDTEDIIASYETEINEIEQEIDGLNETIEKRNEILKKRIASYQANGGKIGFLEVILGSKSFNEFISNTNAINRITTSDAELIEQQERDKALIEINQREIERKITEQEELLVELVGMEQLIEEQKNEVEKKLEELNKKEKQFQEKKASLKSEDNKLARLEANVRQSMRAYSPRKAPVATSNYTVPSGGGGKSVAINAGFKYLGVPYRSAGKTPSGFDCSGFVSWAYGQGGYNLPSSTAGLQYVGQKISLSEAKPGDLVFFNTYKTNGHVGIYLGNGKFIGSQNSTGLAVADMTTGYWKNKFAGHVRRVN